MPTEISWEIRGNAEELYIIGGLTYDEVAEETGVSLAQVKRWGSDDDWTDRKKEYRQSIRDNKRKTVLLKSKLLDSALKSLDHRHVYAFSNLEQATKPKSLAVKTVTEDRPPVKISDRDFDGPGDAIEALEEALRHKVNVMISVPNELDLKAIKDLKQALELLEQMKAKYNPEEKSDKAGGLSDAAADEIRRKILGIE